MVLERFADWWMNARARVRSRAALVIHVLVTVGALVFGVGWFAHTIRPLTHAVQPELPPDQGDVRFGLPLEKRKEIFREIAAAEPAAVQAGKNSFPGPELAWSAEDHRGAFEQKTVAALTTKYGVSTTQIYLCLDEGIRAHWAGPDGQPLNPHTVPLHPRRKYGW